MKLSRRGLLALLPASLLAKIAPAESIPDSFRGDSGERIMVDVQLQPKQRQFVYAETPYVLWTGGRGSGMTFACREKARIAAEEGRTVLLRSGNSYTHNENGRLFRGVPNVFVRTPDEARHGIFDTVIIDNAAEIGMPELDWLIGANSFAGKGRQLLVAAHPGSYHDRLFKSIFLEPCPFRSGMEAMGLTEIHSTMRDNPILLANCPEYQERVLCLSEEVRDKWASGDWS